MQTCQQELQTEINSWQQKLRAETVAKQRAEQLLREVELEKQELIQDKQSAEQAMREGAMRINHHLKSSEMAEESLKNSLRVHKLNRALSQFACLKAKKFAFVVITAGICSPQACLEKLGFEVVCIYSDGATLDTIKKPFQKWLATLNKITLATPNPPIVLFWYCGSVVRDLQSVKSRDAFFLTTNATKFSVIVCTCVYF